jgi:predicted RNA-binding Zn-ribbon protein involved in translation (DUF1610 family)
VSKNLRSILDAKCRCRQCGWKGTVEQCEPDVDGDGSLGCPIDKSVVDIEAQVSEPNIGDSRPEFTTAEDEEEYWECLACGNSLFCLTPRGAYCPDCGAWIIEWERVNENRH